MRTQQKAHVIRAASTWSQIFCTWVVNKFKLHNSNLPTTGPTLCSCNYQHQWWAEVCGASKKEDRFLRVQWVDKCPNSRHPLSVCSSAPQDVTPFIILLHATQLRLAAFFSYNPAFILILWWLSQTLKQTVAPQLALSGRRLEEADTFSYEHLPIHACKTIYLQRDRIE